MMKIFPAGREKNGLPLTMESPCPATELLGSTAAAQTTWTNPDM